MVLPVMLHLAESWWYKQKRSGEKKLVGFVQVPSSLNFYYFSNTNQARIKGTTRKDLHFFKNSFFPWNAALKRDWEVQRAALETGIFIQRSSGELRSFIPYLLLILLQEIVLRWRKGQIKDYGLFFLLQRRRVRRNPAESGPDPGVRTAPDSHIEALGILKNKAN